MEQSVSTYKKIRRLYRQSQKYAASRMEQPELTQSELQLLRHVASMERSASVTWPTRWASIKP